MAATTTTGATRALPSAGGERPRNILTLTALLAGAGGLMLFGALLGVYLLLRSRVEPFIPEDALLDNYLGNMMMITIGMSALTVEWGYSAVKRAVSAQAKIAYVMTIGFGLAFLNLLWYSATETHYGVASHPYGTVLTVMAVAVGVVVAVGIGFALLTLFRVMGGQVSAADPDQSRALGWYWQFTVVASAIVWYTVVVLK